ncbi:MAG: host attachment protein [Paracoccaceae bacterium]|nr:host attachment protein [Paracoccaceae bacterium]
MVEPTRARIVRGIGADGRPVRPDLALRARQPNLTSALAQEPLPEGAGAAVEADEASFAEHIATLLDAHRVAGEFDRVHVVATGRMAQLVKRAMRGPLEAMLGASVVLGLMEGAVDLGIGQLLGLLV